MAAVASAALFGAGYGDWNCAVRELSIASVKAPLSKLRTTS